MYRGIGLAIALRAAKVIHDESQNLAAKALVNLVESMLGWCQNSSCC